MEQFQAYFLKYVLHTDKMKRKNFHWSEWDFLKSKLKKERTEGHCKSQPHPSMIKERKEKDITAKEKEKKRRTWDGEERKRGGADLSVLSLNCPEVCREQKTNSTSRDFSDNPLSHKHSHPRIENCKHKEERGPPCSLFTEMSPWDPLKRARQHKYYKHKLNPSP